MKTKNKKQKTENMHRQSSIPVYNIHGQVFNLQSFFYFFIFVFSCLLCIEPCITSAQILPKGLPKELLSTTTTSRIKDIAKIQGVRENQLIGYGLVVGLNGTGDGIKMTKQSIVNLMQKVGINTNIGDINVDNVAAVVVTATLPPFVKAGDKIDVTVSSIGDADSLRGGTLILTPLRAANGEVYAVAQGSLSIGGYSEGGAGAKSKKGFPTSGKITSGATVEKEVPVEFVDNNIIYINLNSPDFTTSYRVSKVINDRFGKTTAEALDAATIKVGIPKTKNWKLVEFIASLENLRVEQDEVAKVVINEKTGTIIIGNDVVISPVAIAHGSLSVTVKEKYDVVQPPPLSGGETAVIPKPGLKVQEPKVSLTRVTTGDIVKALNTFGVTPSDIIAILQALKTAGALQAEIVVM